MKKTLLLLPIIMLAAISVNAQAFITTWKTDNPGTSTSTQIAIPTNGGGYNYNIFWEEVGNAAHNGIINNVVGNQTIEFGTPGTYRVVITGTFPRIYFNNGGDKSKILTIEQWSNIAWTSMQSAFFGCNNLTIPASDAPNLANVTNLDNMFYGATSFNQPINHWDVSNVVSMGSMFRGATSFNQPLDSWDVSSVTNMGFMFYSATSFNQSLGSWDVSSVSTMNFMFSVATVFNQTIDSWNVSSVTNMDAMFGSTSSFNQPLNNWDVSNVVSMGGMFNGAIVFNQPINSWNVSSVTSMVFMFKNATAFNQSLDSWNVSGVTNMGSMFENASSFNQPLNNWDVSNVTNMAAMFYNATSFNQPLNGWDVGSVATMSGMLYQATSFNQPLSSWDVSNVINMSSMFRDASSFDQSLASWDISNVTTMSSMLRSSGLSPINYDATLLAWATQNVKQGVAFGALGLKFCAAEDARNMLRITKGWVFSGDSKDCAQTITFQLIPNKLVGDPEFELMVSASYGLAVSLSINDENVATISDKTVSIIGKGNTTITASLLDDTYYKATPIQRQLIVRLYNQTITFNELPAKVYGNESFNLTATSSSDLPINYASSNTAVATISGSTVTLHGAGATTITAFQPGDDDYHAAVSADRLLTVAKADQTITFNALADKSTLDEPFELSATASSNLPVSFSSSNTDVATISGSTVTIVGAGVTTITGLQSGDVNYNAALDVQHVLIVKLGQTITFDAVANKTIGDAPFPVIATASSGLPVSFSAVTNNITLNGNKVTLLAPGQATLQTTQAGDAVYAAALPVDQTFCINPAKPTLTVSGLGTGTTVLTSSATGGNVWYVNGTIIETASSTNHTVTQPGVYTTTTVFDGCISEPSDPLALIVTEAEHPLSSLVSVYPNPVHDILNIDVSALTNTTEVSLYDVAGRLVKTTTGTKRIQLNTEALALGIYVVYIKNEKQLITKRISKQ